jgi:hypothetical protein
MQRKREKKVKFIRPIECNGCTRSPINKPCEVGGCRVAQIGIHEIIEEKEKKWN